MKNYREIFAYLCTRQDWICKIWEAKASDREKQLVYSGKKRAPAIGQLHHFMAHNTARNRKKWPLLTNHVWNLMAVSPEWHMAYHDFGKRSDIENEKREQFLQRHPAIVEWAKRI